MGKMNRTQLTDLLNEISSRGYKQSISATSSQKKRNAYGLVRKKLREIDQILEYSNKLKEELGTTWNLNEQQIQFIQEKLKSISTKLKTLTK